MQRCEITELLSISSSSNSSSSSSSSSNNNNHNNTQQLVVLRPLSLLTTYEGGNQWDPLNVLKIVSVRPWYYSRRSCSSSQATGKVFSTEHAIYSSVGKL